MIPAVAERIDEMKKYLEFRKVNVSIQPNTIVKTDRVKRKSIQPISKPKVLRYDKKMLESLTNKKIKSISRAEKISEYKDMTKKQQIDKLLKFVDLPNEREPEAPYGMEILSRCESEYKNAPWVKTRVPIMGMAVNIREYPELGKFATNIMLEDGWFGVNVEWYRMCCRGERTKFIPNAVSYVTNGKNLIVETVQMFENAKIFKPKYSPKAKIILDKQQVKQELAEKRKEKLAWNDAPVLMNPIKSAEKVSNKPIGDLAPGLFRHLRTLLAGKTFYCRQCNISIREPSKFKSVHDGNKVQFCTSECFNKYKFDKD
jgi:hypothetical protein